MLSVPVSYDHKFFFKYVMHVGLCGGGHVCMCRIAVCGHNEVRGHH